MIRILVVVPYEELFDPVRLYLAGVDTKDFQIELEHIVGTDSEAVERPGVDIVVARGMTMKALARANPSLHLVDIPITAGDLIAALWKHRESRGRGPVGILLTDTGICDQEQLRELTGIPIQLRQCETEAELFAAVDELREGGIESFIGGLTLCRRCRDLGLDHFHIKSGEEAMTGALNQAIAAARSLNRERTRRNLVSTLLNNAEDAILALSNEGRVIAANTKAEELFLPSGGPEAGNRGPREGGALEGVLLAEALPEAICPSTAGELGGRELVRSFGGQLWLVKILPIVLGEERFGSLVTCRDAEELREAESRIRKELAKKGLVARYRFGDLLTRNPVMRGLIAAAEKYSRVDSSVFIIGETGTGKELFAQSIHNASRRSAQPFVAVNCAALPEPLLESELFGYAEGSFSGAAKGGRIGLFELAHKGSIFLDEIGEMPLSLQAKILRVLQEREIRKVGGDSVVPVDVRIISASNVDILEKVRAGSFRQDLYYRINLLNLNLPPLRDRPDDLLPLFEHFIGTYSQAAGKIRPRLAPGLGEVLASRPWPGNIRELRNFCERLVILNDEAELDRRIVEEVLEGAGLPLPRGVALSVPAGPWASLAERLTASGMEVGEFAASLGISRSTLWRRLKREAKASSLPVSGMLRQ